MFQFNKEYILKNSLVELSPLKLIHEQSLFKVSNDKDIWQHFTENGLGRQNFNSYIKTAIEKRNAGLHYPMVIKDLRNNQLAGITRIYDVDNKLKNVKIGHSWLGKQFQGTGINKSCKYLLFEFLFEKIKMERIGFGASALNIKSIKALQSVACKIEGELRSFLPINNSKKRVNIVLLSILREDWIRNTKKELLIKINKISEPQSEV